MEWIRAHVLLSLLIAAGAVTFVWLLLLRERLRMTWYAALVFAVLHVAYGVFCVRVFARMEGAGSGAMSLFGAVFFMPLGYWAGAKTMRRPVSEVFDIFAPAMVFTLLCARINCLYAGCCLGRFIPGTAHRWPTRESEIVFYLVFLGIIIPRVLRGGMKGRMYPLYMISYGAFRAVEECFREAGTHTFFHLSHIWALCAIGMGLSVYMEQNKRLKLAGRQAVRRKK